MSVKRAQPPWLKEGEHDRWITVTVFARMIVLRSPKTVYRWLQQGDVLPLFGYRAFRDVGGRWRIQVRRSDLNALKSQPSRSSQQTPAYD